MKALKIIRDNARKRREVKNDLTTAEYRLQSVSIVYKALEDPDTYDLFIATNEPGQGSFVCNLKPSIAKQIRKVILEDLDKTINAELAFIHDLRSHL